MKLSKETKIKIISIVALAVVEGIIESGIHKVVFAKTVNFMKKSMMRIHPVKDEVYEEAE